MKFRAVLELHGKTATGLEVPRDVVTDLDAGKRPAVRVTLNGYTYRSTVASMGGRFMLPVSAAVRAEAGASAGDELEVEVALDAEPRMVELPPELAAALDAEPTLRTAWDALTFTHRREHVEAIAAAKKPDTRQRRVAKAVEMLRSRSAG